MIAPRHRPRRSRRRLVPTVLALEGRQLLSADVLTYHNDNTRAGANTAETTLTPANVNAGSFGKVGFLAVDGKVDAQPLVKRGVTIPGQGVHDVVYVATENDSVYAFDAVTGATLWHAGPSSLIPGETPVPATDVNCTQVEPTIGITSTPVIDPTTNTIYVVAMSKAVADGAATYYQRIHALDLGTGLAKVAPRAIDRSISVPGAGPGGDGSRVYFDPKMYKERSALTLSNGVVYTGWSSHCDIPEYTGWVMGFRASDLGLVSVLNVNPNGTPAAANTTGSSGASFWSAGGGFAVDAAGSLYNITSNGPFDPSVGDYGDSYLKLDTGGGTALTVADYFAPSNQQELADKDLSLGASGVVLLPDVVDASGATRHLMVGSGKDGNIYLVDRDDLGGYSTTTNNIVQTIAGALGGPIFGTPAFYNGSAYFGAVGASIRQFALRNGQFAATPTSQTAHTFGYPGSTVSISANGTSDGIVWAAENGGTAGLYAFDANDLSRELYDSNQAGDRDRFGVGNKFITPTIANGRVYVGTTNGVGVFGLLAPPSSGEIPPPSPLSVPVAPFASPGFYVGGFDLLGAVGDDAVSGESSLTYTWSVVATPAGAPTPFFSQNGTNASKLVGVAIAAPGSYTFRVTIASPQDTTTRDVTVLATVPLPSFAAPAFAGPVRALGVPLQLGAFAVDQAFSTGALTYTWSTLATPRGARAPRFAANNSAAAGLTAVNNLNRAGTYVFQVRATNPFGQSTTSQVSVLITAKRRR